jgi:hypothetical protein
MKRKISILGVAALACLCFSGCASVIDFQVPAEFQGKKVKEDPPGTMLPLPVTGVKTC